MNDYKITFTKQELDRIWYVFNEELNVNQEVIEEVNQ